MSVAGRKGVLLPAALLLLLGGTLMAAGILVTVRSTVVLADGDRHLARSLAVRGPFAPAGSPIDPAASAPLPAGDLRTVRAGYVLVRGEAPGVTWSTWSAAWRVDPGRVAASLRAAAETGGPVGGTGGELGPAPADSCDDAAPVASHWARAAPRRPLPDPPLPSPPRIGPIGIERLAARAEASLRSGESLPADLPPSVFAAPDDLVVTGGSASGLLLVSGDLRLEGDAGFRGLVMVGGDLVLEPGAVVTGAAGVAGELRFEGGGRISGCRETVRNALAGLGALETPFALPGGHFLGRY